MATDDKLGSNSPQLDGVDPYSKEHRRSVMMAAIALMLAGALVPSKECLLAGAICAGAVVFTKKVFG